MCRTSILTSLYDGTPFSSKGTNKNDGTWQRPSVPSRFLEIPLPCTRFRSFRLRRESDLDYGKHVCVVVEADKEIILLAFVGDYARAALLLVLCKKKKKPSQSIRCPRYLVVKHFRSLLSFSHDQPCTFLRWNNASYIDQRAKKRDSVRKKRCSPSYVVCAFIGKRKKKEEKLVTWKPPRSGKVFSYDKRFSNISRLQS